MGEQGDCRIIKKLAVKMAMATFTPVNYYLSCTLTEMGEYAEIISQIEHDAGGNL